jgi:hypothetical protein
MQPTEDSPRATTHHLNTVIDWGTQNYCQRERPSVQPEKHWIGGLKSYERWDESLQPPGKQGGDSRQNNYIALNASAGDPSGRNGT